MDNHSVEQLEAQLLTPEQRAAGMLAGTTRAQRDTENAVASPGKHTGVDVCIPLRRFYYMLD